ncbi:hypothetical protein [Sphingobium fuliginis]|uniref:Uncharacterized protein n=1 Tax=Sphingobium fuliginis (strain ATCC 27551) TaxID=336203 RepID=A0A292ZDR4_SPHSA|nr:hypothetical protein [Sphingobium fuliginis]GAY20984.1 hypothetical protein SFOMI_1514 [Sphingobium fuliginis]
MELIDLSITHRGFAPHSIAISLRTAGCCHGMRHRPDCRILAGIGLLSVQPGIDGGFSIEADATYLQPGDIATDLLDWLNDRVPDDGAIVTWDKWWPAARRLAALADPERHPVLAAAAGDTAGRWRELPAADTWYLRQARAMPVPCICDAGVQVADCHSTVPLSLLPDAEIAIPQLKLEAIAGWLAWARQFADFDLDPIAAQAVRALEIWRATMPISDHD